MPLLTMKITSFSATRLNEWILKLSLNQTCYTFLLIAYNPFTGELIIKTFDSEADVTDFVAYLCEVS